MGFYVGPIWASHMGLRWFLHQGSIWDPHVQYGSRSGFGLGGSCTTNHYRIDLCLILYIYVLLNVSKDIKYADMHK